MEYSQADPNVLYAGTVYVLKSTDGGATWAHAYTEKLPGGGWKGGGLELMNTDGVGFDPADPSLLYVAYDDMGFFRSSDGGISFVPTDPSQDFYGEYEGAKDIVVDPQSGDIYLSRFEGSQGGFNAGFMRGRVYLSTDKGDTWSDRFNGLPDGRPDLILDGNAGSPMNRTLYCAVFHHGVYKSTNSGQSWFSINEGLGPDSVMAWKVSIDPANSQTLYLGTNSYGQQTAGVYKSTDGGGNWTKLTSFPALDVMSLKLNPLDGRVFACATDDFGWSATGGLYVSANGGTTWSKIFDQPRVADIDFEPNNVDLFYVVSQQWYRYIPTLEKGVFRTTDGGQSWTNLRSNLGHTFINFVRVNPHNTSQLYVGTGGGGLWRGNILTTNVTALHGPYNFTLDQNFQNPFNPSTTISYTLPRPGSVRLTILDILGREIQTLDYGHRNTGSHRVEWRADLPSGLYFYRLSARLSHNQSTLYSAVKKLVVIR